jgi:hypothetical protein
MQQYKLRTELHERQYRQAMEAVVKRHEEEVFHFAYLHAYS